MIRGTFIGSLCALMRAPARTIASFVSYATEKKISRTPERFGHGAIEGVVMPRGLTHSSVQGDFIPDHESRHSRRYRDGVAVGALIITASSRSAADQPACGHLLGPDRELLIGNICWSSSTCR